MVGQKAVVRGASILVRDVNFDGFTGRLAVSDARFPFNSVVLLPFAAVGPSRFAKGHRGLNLSLVNGQSGRHPFNQCADKGTVA